MVDKLDYIPKEKRKNILLLCDDIRMHSGIATMGREIVLGTAHHYNWFNLGAALKHPDNGKVFDLSEDINNKLGIKDASVFVRPNNGYGEAQQIRNILKQNNIDGIFIFTDPRYWIWLFEIEREIRSQIPIFYLNIWDDYPAPYYNKTYYDSVDVLMAISKQTKNINEIVLGEKAKDKVIEYVPHGIDDGVFHPIDDKAKLEEFKKSMFQGQDIEFVIFFNSRNIQRKHPADTILAYQHFCDMIGEEKAKKCALVLHTAISDQHGTDLRAVKEALTNPDYVNVYFSSEKISPHQMNMLYNIADVTTLLSSNEGWGLALTESMMAGTMISATVTGGMQDQMKFLDEDGKWIEFSRDFPSNHRGTYKECGEWASPIFPSNISLAGSPLTPYIFDDRVMAEDAAKAWLKIYSLSKEERTKRGLAGREWATSEESQMSAANMCKNVMKSMNLGFEKFTPRTTYDIIKVETLKPNKVEHKLTGY